MLKVSIIANGFQKDYIANLIRGLSKTPCNIDFIGSSLYDINERTIGKNLKEIKDDRMPNSSLTTKFFNNIIYYYKLCRHFIATKPGVVHIQWLNLILTDGIIFPLFFKVLGIKTAYTVHDVLPHNRDHFINRLLFRWVYLTQDHLLVHTRFIKQRLVDEFGINPAKISIFRHGVYEVPDHPSIDRTKARNTLDLDHNVYALLLFGHITKYKGLHLLLEAYAKLVSEDPSVVLLIAGPIASDYKSEFEKLIDSYKSDRIRIFPEHISEKRMEIMFKASDVTVLPYTEASQSGVLFMSYAFGKPVIAPRLGGFPDDIVEGQTGLLFEAGDPDSLAETLKRFRVEWEELKGTGSRRIKTYAHECYSWEKTGDALYKIYSGLILK